MHDEDAIRGVVKLWMEASQRGDTATVLSLMTDDALFMVPGREPFGKDAFAAASAGVKGMKLEGTSDIVELKVIGDWAWARNKLRVVITPPGEEPVARSGYTLTLFQKTNGRWLLARDANLLAPEKK